MLGLPVNGVTKVTFENSVTVVGFYPTSDVFAVLRDDSKKSGFVVRRLFGWVWVQDTDENLQSTGEHVGYQMMHSVDIDGDGTPFFVDYTGDFVCYVNERDMTDAWRAEMTLELSAETE